MMDEKLKYLLSRTRSGVYFSTKFLTALLEPTPIVAQSIKVAEDYLAENKPIFYVSGALTNVSDTTIIKRYNTTGELIKASGGLSYLPHEHGSDPKQNPEITPDDIYTIDFLWGVVLPTAEILWGYPPSLGVGVQLGWCDTYQIPTALLQPSDIRLSRLAEAIAQRVTVIRYDSTSNWQASLHQFIVGQSKTSPIKNQQ
mgnify:CR=1 FL=1